VRFVVVYQREPHAGQMAFADVEQPRTDEQRAALARRMLDELGLDVDVWLDDLGDQSRNAFGDLPSWGIVIRPDGRIGAKLPWAEPDQLAVVLSDLAAAKPARPREPAPAEEGFLAAIGSTELAPHHRHTMLAWLATNLPEHADRRAWLEALRDGPSRQRAGVDAQLAKTEDAKGR
jgi:hypothetical protein